MRAMEWLANCREDQRTLGEIANVVGSAKSTTHSLLKTLQESGYVAQSRDDGRYYLGVSLMHLGDAAREQTGLIATADPIMQSLSQETASTIRLAVRDGFRPKFIHRIDGPSSVRFVTPLGVTEYAHSTAAGKAILAALPETSLSRALDSIEYVRRTPNTIRTSTELVPEIDAIRRRGYATDLEEDLEGVVCVSSIFTDRFGEPIGALSTTTLRSSADEETLSALGRQVVDACRQLTSRLGAPNDAEL